MDMDVDEYGPTQVDKLNVIALEYGVPAGAFCKSVDHFCVFSLHTTCVGTCKLENSYMYM